MEERKKIVTNVFANSIVAERVSRQIEEWCESRRWDLQDFPQFLSLIGIKSPIYVKDITCNDLECISENNKKFTIVLEYNRQNFHHGSCTQMTIKYNNIMQQYYPSSYIDIECFPEKDKQLELTLFARKKVIDKHTTIWFPHIHDTSLSVSVIKNDTAVHIEILGKNMQYLEVEKVLTELDLSQDVSKIYEKVAMIAGGEIYDIEKKQFFHIKNGIKVQEKGYVIDENWVYSTKRG